MLSVSLSFCKEDGIVEGASILGEWIHEDGVGEADVLTFTGSETQGEVRYTEYDDDDFPEIRVSTYSFSGGYLTMPAFRSFPVKVSTLTKTKLRLQYFPDDDETTTFRRR